MLLLHLTYIPFNISSSVLVGFELIGRLVDCLKLLKKLQVLRDVDMLVLRGKWLEIDNVV